jgi:hypothetical protein
MAVTDIEECEGNVGAEIAKGTMGFTIICEEMRQSLGFSERLLQGSQ